MKRFLLFALFGFLATENLEMIRFWNADYQGFCDKVKAIVPKGSTVLASAAYMPGLADWCEIVPHEKILFYPKAGIPPIYKVDYVIVDAEAKDSSLRPLLEPYLSERIATFYDDFHHTSRYAFKRAGKPLETQIWRTK